MQGARGTVSDVRPRHAHQHITDAPLQQQVLVVLTYRLPGLPLGLVTGLGANRIAAHTGKIARESMMVNA